MTHIRLALSFLTRIPVGSVEASAHDHAAGTRYFPVAGAVLAVLAVTMLFAGAWTLGSYAGCVLAVATIFVATGGLHLDGLSDCVDGLAVNGNAAKRLAVMHDARAGAVGAVAVGFWILFKVALVARCVETGTVAQALWCALIFARTPLAFELREGEPATPGRGLFAWLHPEVRREDWVISLCLGAAFLVPAFAPLGDIALRCTVGAVLGVLASAAWHLLWYRKVGGLTGDVLGAAIEIREVAMLAAMATVLPG